MYIKDILHELCDNSSIDINKGKLWNYAVLHNNNEQYVLPLEYTIKQSKIQDGQTLLFEVCLDDGTWPRSQLQQTYTTDNSNNNNNNSGGNKSPQRGTSRSIDQSQPSNISGNNSMKLNDGRVGLGKQLEYRVYICMLYSIYIHRFVWRTCIAYIIICMYICMYVYVCILLYILTNVVTYITLILLYTYTYLLILIQIISATPAI